MHAANPDAALLRLSLRGNAVFSLISGVAFTVAHQPIASSVGFTQPVVILGIGLSF